MTQVQDNSVFLPNRMVHEPARLAILTVLSSCAAADFVFLQNVTALSKGNLSVQLSTLEQAGLIIVTKEIVDKKTRTTARLTDRGRGEIDDYWKAMDAIRARMAKAEKPRRARTKPLPATFSPVTG